MKPKWSPKKSGSTRDRKTQARPRPKKSGSTLFHIFSTFCVTAHRFLLVLKIDSGDVCARVSTGSGKAIDGKNDCSTALKALCQKGCKNVLIAPPLSRHSAKKVQNVLRAPPISRESAKKVQK
jgi:hypothetical protein